MNAIAIRNAVVAIVLVLFCILIGSYAAEDKDVSVVMLAGIVGFIFMVVMGKRSWTLLYLLPPVVSFLPLGILESLPAGFLVAGIVLAYWALMWIMGYVHFKWRALPALDAIVLVLFLYYLLTFYWHPVSINELGIEAEYVGGKDYIWCLLAMVYYVTLSSVPCSYDALYSVLRKALFVTAVAIVISTSFVVFGVASEIDMVEAAGNSRFSIFTGVAMLGYLIIMSKKTLHEILLSPKALVGVLLCGVAILISGWRERLVEFGAVALAICYIKREMTYALFFGVAIYGSLLYLSEEKVVEEYFPFGMQRVLSVVPGIQIRDDIRKDAEGSSEWRKVMWRWALDPRTGYIKDYVWGDGLGQAVSDLNRYNVSRMRGVTNSHNQEGYAAAGTWHSGPIVAVHRTGIVGLALITITFLYGAFLIARVCRSYRRSPMFTPAVVFLCGFYGHMALFYVSAGSLHGFFTNFLYLGLAKVLYCVGREGGIIVSVFSKNRYNPVLIAERQRQELILRGQQESVALHRRG